MAKKTILGEWFDSIHTLHCVPTQKHNKRKVKLCLVFASL